MACFVLSAEKAVGLARHHQVIACMNDQYPHRRAFGGNIRIERRDGVRYAWQLYQKKR
jgi:hypothetical protein